MLSESLITLFNDFLDLEKEEENDEFNRRD